MILRNLWRRKTRTLLTVLGVAVGVAAVVSLSAFGEGFASGFEHILGGSGADLVVAQQDAMIIVLSALDESIGDELRQIPGVESVSGAVLGILQMPASPYFLVTGEDPVSASIRRYRLIEGMPLSGRKQILLGKLAAQAYHKAVGETFRVNVTSYRVVGIYETGSSYEDGGAVMSLSDAQSVFGRRRLVSYFNLQVSDARRIDRVKQAIEARWPNLAASRTGEATRQTEALDVYRSFGWFLGAFAVLVGGLGMMNTMLMSVLERTREIGVLRALGWRRRRVVAMIVGESLVLALAGGGLGIALGVGLTSLSRLSPAVQSLLQGAFTPRLFVQALVTAALLGVLGGLYPAWRAARLAPVEAMRHEGGAGGGARRVPAGLARLASLGPLRSLWRQPMRTLVTVLGIGIGVAFVVAISALTEGFRVAFTQMAGAGQADLMAEQAEASDLSFSSIDERLANRLRGRPEVRSVSKVIMGVSTAPGVAYLLILGLEPREDYIRHYRVREGRALARPHEIMLGRLAAEGLKKQVGDALHLGGRTFRVVGIYENALAYEDAGAAVVLQDAQAMFHKPRQVSILGIALRDPERAQAVAQALEQQFPEVIVSQVSGATERMMDFATLNAALTAILALAIVVGGIVMTNSMLMSVFERTAEIGVLRAVGWRRRRVLGMILGESLTLSLLSSLIGLALGIGLNALLTLEPSFGAFMTPAYTPTQFLQVAALAALLGALGGLYPAWHAANLRPIEALRYE